ncbi:MAG: hypothetical protein KF866_11420 [Phycisphaeraceae bacterium]|nr:hypothetical protein [Phycisphaeraceae bacterium]MCW5754216.1 hypothetical protein [Phycisphaeraceae bacterium]
MCNRTLTVLAFGAALVITVAFFKVAQKDTHRDQVREAVSIAIEQAPDYTANGPWYYDTLSAFHDKCFDRHFILEKGRCGRVITLFDAQAYLEDNYEIMIRTARNQGRVQQAEHLAKIRPSVRISI